MIESELRDRLRKQFADFIRSKKMRQTPERFAILDKVLELHVHFEIDELYAEIESDYHVSRATVYNTIELLCECNILRRHFLNGTQSVYELAEDRHIHLICMKCGDVREIRGSDINDYFDKLKFKGFSPTFIATNIYGICSKCERAARRAKSRE